MHYYCTDAYMPFATGGRLTAKSEIWRCELEIVRILIVCIVVSLQFVSSAPPPGPPGDAPVRLWRHLRRVPGNDQLPQHLWHGAGALPLLQGTQLPIHR